MCSHVTPRFWSTKEALISKLLKLQGEGMASGPSSCSAEGLPASQVAPPARGDGLRMDGRATPARGKGAERGEEGAGLCRNVLALVGQFFFLRDREEGHKAAGLATKGLREQKVWFPFL